MPQERKSKWHCQRDRDQEVSGTKIDSELELFASFQYDCCRFFKKTKKLATLLMRVNSVDVRILTSAISSMYDFKLIDGITGGYLLWLHGKSLKAIKCSGFDCLIW